MQIEHRPSEIGSRILTNANEPMMKFTHPNRQWLVALVVLASAFSSIAQVSATQQAARRRLKTEIAPSNPKIAYTGRWNFSNPAEPWCAWQGSSFVVAFRGTKLLADLNSGTVTEYFRIVVDGNHAGAKKISVAPGRSTYPLTSELPLGVHQVEVVKESYQGHNATFYGLTVFGFGLEDPPTRPSRRIEFYGDSNLAGYSLAHEQNNGANAYVGCHFGLAGIAARMLGAEYHNISASGETIAGLHNKFDRMDWWSPNPQWDFANYRPDLVVVNLGANDVGAPEILIKARYHAFLDDLRAVHADAHIMLFNAWGWDFNEPANYIHEVIADRADPNMSSMIFPWLFEQWHGCEFDHAGMARVLVEHVSSILGWSYGTSDVVSGLGVGGNVANGGFESIAPFGGFGWRYKDSAGIHRIHDALSAFEGEHFVRLANQDAIHQPNPANNGDEVTVSFWARGVGASNQIEVTIDFRNQQIYTAAIQSSTQAFALTNTWQEFTLSATAPTTPPDPVFHTRLTFRPRGTSSVEVDAVSMTVD